MMASTARIVARGATGAAEATKARGGRIVLEVINTHASHANCTQVHSCR